MAPHPLARPGTARALIAASACIASSGGLTRLAIQAVAAAPAPDALVCVTVLALGAVAAAVLGTGCAMLAVTSLAATLGHRWTRTEVVATRLVPSALRRALTVGIGAGLTLGLGTTALADEVDVGWEITTGSTAEATPQPGALTAEPISASSRSAAPASAPAPQVSPAPVEAAQPASTPPPRTVTVQPGDSLWGISASLLPTSADDQDIAAAWPLIYAANSGLIGPDPGLIHPGDVLTIPMEVSA